jgi:hypothetical protein
MFEMDGLDSTSVAMLAGGCVVSLLSLNVNWVFLVWQVSNLKKTMFPYQLRLIYMPNFKA